MKNFTLVVYDGAGAPRVTTHKYADVAYAAFLAAYDSEASKAVLYGERKMPIFTFNKKKLDICDEEANMERERKAQLVLRSCYSE